MVYILTKGKKIVNAGKNENVELPHTQVFAPDDRNPITLKYKTTDKIVLWAKIS